MKKLFLFFGLTSLLFTTSCSKDDENENSASSIAVSSNTSEHFINDPITFLVMGNNGRNYTNSATIFINNSPITGNIYTPTTTGNIEVYAKYNNLTSPTIILNIQNAINFNKKVLIEDFTGTWCGFCPRVSFAIEQVKDRTDDAVVVAIHRGGSDPYNFNGAVPLENQIGLSGYPTAMLNRNTTWGYPETSNNSINQAVNLTSGINPKIGIALETETISNSSLVKVKVKFGRNFNNLKLVVYALEDKLFHDQTNYTQYYGGSSTITNFQHDHVLRAVLTNSILGDNITGSTNFDEEYSKTFNFNIPTNINTTNLKFVAFIIDSSNMALNSREAGPNEIQEFEIE